MKFQLVTGKQFFTKCVSCGEAITNAHPRQIFADLEGPSFKAYYCYRCKTLSEQGILKQNQDGFFYDSMVYHP